MSPAGAGGSGPTGNITAPSGTYVTSWALRSFIENAGGYGWTFESGTSSGQPSVVAEIRASDGLAKFNGGTYSPIFYDSDNTGFFVDPSSTSVLNVIRGSTIQHSNGNTAITLDNGTYLMLRDPSGRVGIYLGNSNDPGNYYDNANHYFRNLSATTVGRIDSSGNAIFSGNVTAYGSPSDRRLKENIQPIKDALATVLRLSGCTFDWKEGTDEFKMVGLRADTGFIADEVRDVIPSFVREDENGYLSLRDRGFAALLVEAIKELSAKVDALR
jgi:hypothetical protein